MDHADRAEQRAVRSFDIFDTLLARAVPDPVNVFDIVEGLGIPNFKALRLQAQSLSNQTWADIYAQYQRLADVDASEAERIKRLELQVETQVSYLISENYHKVRDGDILVSDMYLPPDEILTILRARGFRKDVTVFVSSAGKASGAIWPDLQQTFTIEQHVGDNLHSDVRSPKGCGIPASHYVGSQYSPIEKQLAELGASETAAILKRFRLTNPLDPDTPAWRLYEAQAQGNLPFLLLMAFHLKEIMDRERLSRLLFTMRDGCLLQPLFETVFPQIDSVRFYSSRIAFTEARTSYRKYVKDIYKPGSSLIFDLHGGFKSGRALFEEIHGVLPRVHIFSGAYGRAPKHPEITFDVEAGSNHVELLNLDMVGTLITIDEAGEPTRAPLLDYDVDIGLTFSTILRHFIETIRGQLDVVRRELTAIVGQVRWSDIHEQIARTVRDHPDLSKIALTEHKSLTQLANEHRSDKGSQYRCAHCYTYVYESVLRDMGAKPHFALLEIGLNRDGVYEIPSLRSWKAYFGARVTLYGLDIDPGFMRCHDPSAGIHILTGDQSDPRDLIRCALSNPSGYDVIIDDGSHMSSHQQISLGALWSSLRPGGLYIVEDLHYQPAVETVINTRELLLEWQAGNPEATPYICRADAARIVADIATLEFHDSLSSLWGLKRRKALAILRKRA